MKKYVINGKFMSDRMQGIVRYGRELLLSLDRLLDSEKEVELLLTVPSDAVDIPAYKNVKIRILGTRTGIMWEQLDFGKFLRRHNEYTAINLCNVTPFFVRPGITAVHDIMYKTFPQNYRTLRNKISRLWHCLQYQYVFSYEKKILTVSEFSKREIEKNYPSAKGKIKVIPDGWQHVLNYKESPDWRKRYPFLQEGEYYFSMATLAKNKNIKWTLEVAKRNPDAVFALGGKAYDSKAAEIPPNVHMLGFITDEDACALVKNCKAFLYPSIYEGFGIPPLEALGLGAKVICSNASSLPEVMMDSAVYIDPYDYDIKLDDIMKNVRESQKALNKYSWDKSARLLLEMLKKYN